MSRSLKTHYVTLRLKFNEPISSQDACRAVKAALHGYHFKGCTVAAVISTSKAIVAAQGGKEL